MNGRARRITLLGRVAIEPDVDGHEAGAWRGRRAELVFAYLAAEHQRLVTLGELADALWPKKLPETWEAGLRGVLTEVRRFLSDNGLDPAEVLTTARRGYQMHLPDTVTVDLDEARDALAAAKTCVAGGDDPAAAEHAARASSLARLPFLPNHDCEWVDGVRRELDSIHARGLELEARAHASAGDLAAAASAAERLVKVEPFNEIAHQLRIRILGEAGDRSGAMKAYEHCRAVLAAELGVEPSDETAAVYRAAVEHEGASTRATPAAPSAPPDVRDLHSLSVLVVEDHDFQRRTATMLLRNLGIGTVGEASDGAAALTVLAGSPPADVIVCDIDMPGMDGVEFIRHVAEDELAGAVIIASALDAKVIQAVRAVSEGYGLQVLGAIEKPLTARRLGDLLSTYRAIPRTQLAVDAGLANGAVALTGANVRTAFDDGRITFHLQPAVDVFTGRVTSANSLPRWYESDRGWISPSLFVPILERERLLADLSARALQMVCVHLGRFATAGLDVTISVDIARDSVHVTEMAEDAAGAARASGVDPASITFALDERALRTAPAAALGLLTRLRVKSFGVSLANFGTAHADLQLLRAIPLTEARLAPHLVAGAAGDPQRARAIEDAIELGRELDVTIVGDGCESEDDLRLLLGLGCDRVAGSFIADAMPGEEFPSWVATWDPDRLGVGGLG